ncbi:MAG: hypothetical protein Q6367_017065 [Candidatus Freyarchaeota archaeon]
MSEEIYKLYEETIAENIHYLKKLEKELGYGTDLAENLRQVLSTSARNLSDKWRSEAKYLRTKYSKMAIPDYPEEVLKISIFVDAVVNLLDDVLDEELTKEQKAVYLIELIRVLTFHHGINLPKNLKKLISDYFNKIIFVAVSENSLYKKLLGVSDESVIFDLCAKSYLCRSLDMDIFVELPLTKNGYRRNEIKSIVESARLFRVINLVKKDYVDLLHDKKFGITTPLTILGNKNIPIEKFVLFLDSYCKRMTPTPKSERSRLIIENFSEMVKKEEEFLKKNLRVSL